MPSKKKIRLSNSKNRRLQLKENRRSSSTQQQLREGVTYKSSVDLENITVSKTKTISPPTSLSESDIIKDIKAVQLAFLAFRLLVYQMIVTLLSC